MADGFYQQIQQAFKNLELARSNARAELDHNFKVSLFSSDRRIFRTLNQIS